MSEPLWNYYTVYFAGPVTIDMDAPTREIAVQQAITTLRMHVPNWIDHPILGVLNFITAEERSKFVTLHILP